ncbi:prepilin peptidase [Nanoarchaeota archaeon]
MIILPQIIITAVVVIYLVICSYTDIKTHEVPDWISYGMIFSGIMLNAMFAVILGRYIIILHSLIGLLIGFVISWIMFYSGQWGGGDAKVLMGLGALIGLELTFERIPFLMDFLVNVILIGAIFGIVWSFGLMLINRKKFVKDYRKRNKNKNIRRARNMVILVLVFSIVAGILIKDLPTRILCIGLGVIIAFTFYSWRFMKSVEAVCMLKNIDPEKITPGDWIAKEIKIDGKYITGPKDLGIEPSQIRKLIQLKKAKKINKVLVKYGIPFTPSFLISFIVTIVFGGFFGWLL